MHPVCVHDILNEAIVEATAPCRVDAGGTWDIKAMALPLVRENPVTVNLALDLRTRVRLVPYRRGWVRISSRGFRPEGLAREAGSLPFDPPLGLFFAAVERFGFQGVEVRIASESPVRSALGGSSTALTALLLALSRLGTRLGRPPMSPRDLLLLGYHLEDGVSGGFCGMQDQAAAVYGGVNLWHWRYGGPGTPYRREPLLSRRDCGRLSECILVADSGLSHDSGRVNRGWVETFLAGRNRDGWVEANRAVLRLGAALKARDWEGAAGCLREEMAIRRDITPDALIPETRRLIEAAEAEGCGARFAGAGSGGAVWAIGDRVRIQALRMRWAGMVSSIRGAKILSCGIDPGGVM